ncbi:type III secretion system effector [Pectobacterium parmentieri]|uniref:putative virulence factor n=1 Tax=Pectobacterium parmentieri TaxID=1905730 RepID=UPI000CDD08C2|nr:virulence factor SrfC family protein [Pectobacterium parmentieri]AYG99906.1 type III secretion system effector [Pectobacterium parmentieri]AYH04389.1 type III secretion system effector [Pectobacterium parmentieri]AYH13211.1 type III secretion system effector [Pectobacterium parmentieri]AYH21913.1 type III secretion system effector [Pectobacterium parmentieri]AYH26144.1 type III secretion system effector [Pectobacterium parmentieri]
MSTINSEQIIQGWQNIEAGAGQAIDWIATVREDAPHLDREADHLTINLRRSRNKARRLAQAAAKPMTVGFFGLSQAGKSYLISALAAGENGNLETQLAGKQLDFLKHINPPGGGKEATGLVTRFSRRGASLREHQQVSLLLFSEVEMGKILANAFIHDFNQEKFNWQYDEKRTHNLLMALAKRRNASRVPGVTEDDVVSLWDYLSRHAGKSQSRLALHYWPQAIALAPWLTPKDRGVLFSVLWGDVPELTEAYTQFAQTLQRLGGAPEVRAPLHTLVQEKDGLLVQHDSIMNVDMLERLNKEPDVRIDVTPVQDGQAGASVEISLAELAALTVELHIPLLTPPREPLFESVDLLDFPGYRGRLGVESMDDIRREVKSEDSNPLAQLILRGKVAYLFERYTENQEMNVLVVCTASTKQSDVKEVGDVLNEWINYTQGADTEARGRRLPGLIWALTMFDLRISQGLSHDEAILRQSWGLGGMIKMAMTERFGKFKWMQEWQQGQAFNNTFLVRKPGQITPFIRIENEKEDAIREESKAQLALMRKTFLEDSAVTRYIATPDAAWDAMLSLNDGGMRRMADYLSQVARPEVKLERIAEQLQDMRGELVEGGLGKWYQPEGEEEVAKKNLIAQEILAALKKRNGMHGELLARLVPTRRSLQELYLQQISVEPEEATEEEADFFDIGVDDAFGLDAPVAATHSHETAFARQALQLWINHLRDLPETQAMQNYINLPRPVIALLVDELITGLLRLKLEDALVSVMTNTEQAGVRRERMVERQVSRVLHVMSNFVTWLGYLTVPETKRPVRPNMQDQAIFTRPVQCDSVQWMDDERLTRLTPQQLNYSAIFIIDWLIGLEALIAENAGHSAGREISVAQNEKLGAIIHRIKTAQE